MTISKLQGAAKIIIYFNMNDVTSFVSKETKNISYEANISGEPIKKRKRGRPPKTQKLQTDSESDGEYQRASNETKIQKKIKRVKKHKR